MSGKEDFIAEKSEKKVDFSKILIFLKKLNPYKAPEVDAEMNLVESASWVRYCSFLKWVIDVLLNGLFANITLWTVRFQPLNPFLMIADGAAVWFISVLLGKLWVEYVDGKIKIGVMSK